MNNTKNITNDIQVWSAYAKEIGTNGEQGDKQVWINIAPEVGGPNEYLYIDTNGDPSLVGWIEDGEVIYAEEALEWIDNEAWIKEAIEASALITSI